MGELLFLTQRIPYPPTKGDKIRSWHILKHLAAQHRVHLGCFIDDPHDHQYETFLRDVCASVHCEPLSPPLARLRSLSALVRREPLTLRYFSSPALQDWVDQLVECNPIEHVFVFCSAMAPYALQINSAVRVLDMVDVDSQKWLQYAAASGRLRRAIYAREAKELLRFERRMAQLFHCSLFVSEAEAALFRDLAPESAARVFAVSNGVDVDFFSPDRDYSNPYPSLARKLVFTGAMDYRPNIEAVSWFVDAVLPELGEIEFWIVGANPTSTVRRLAKRPGVNVTGRVADVRPYLRYADAVVAPLLTARGIQNKILEAMAMAKPVIATPQAKEGIDAVDGEELLVASDPAGFESAVRIVLSGAGRRFGERARIKVVAQYSWSRSFEAIDQHLRGGTTLSSSVYDPSPRTLAR